MMKCSRRLRLQRQHPPRDPAGSDERQRDAYSENTAFFVRES